MAFQSGTAAAPGLVECDTALHRVGKIYNLDPLVGLSMFTSPSLSALHPKYLPVCQQDKTLRAEALYYAPVLLSVAENQAQITPQKVEEYK